MRVKEALRKFGVKSAETQVDRRSVPRGLYEPKPPAKIQAKMEQVNK